MSGKFRLVTTMLLTVLFSGSLSSQVLEWRQLTEMLPGATLKRIVETEGHLLAFSHNTVYVTEKSSLQWNSRVFPEELYLQKIHVTESETEEVTLWGYSALPIYELVYSTDLGITWNRRPIKYVPTYVSRDETFWSFHYDQDANQTVLYKSTDKGITYVEQHRLQNVVTMEDIVELSDGRIVALDIHSVPDALYVFNKDGWYKTAPFGKDIPVDLESYNNTILAASTSILYQCNMDDGVWKSYNADLELQKGEYIQNAFVKTSKSGDVVYVRNHSLNKSISCFKKIGDESFSANKVRMQRTFNDAMILDRSVMFVENTGLWVLENDTLNRQSNGLIAPYMVNVAVSNDDSDVSVLYYGEIFYKHLKSNEKWETALLNTRAINKAENNHVCMFHDGKKAIFYNGLLYYQTGRNEEWKTSELPRHAHVEEILRMKQHKDKIFLLGVENILVSHDFGQTYDYSKGALGANIGSIFCVKDDTTFIVAKDNGIQVVTPLRTEIIEKPGTGVIREVLFDSIFGIVVVYEEPIYWYTKTVVCSRRLDESTWNCSEDVVFYGNDEFSEYIGRTVVGPNSTLYLSISNSQFIKFCRYKLGTQRIESIDSAKYGEHFNDIYVKGNRIYRSRSNGMIEYADIPKSITRERKEVIMDNIQVYPQPASTQITIAGLTPGSELRVVDMQGCEVYSIKVDESTVAVNSSQFVPGVYTVITNGKSSLFMVHR